MKPAKHALAAAQLLLMFPAVLFMSAVVVRNLQLLPEELAPTVQRIVMWYSARQWTLWVLLIALPLAVLITGCLTLLRSWRDDAELRQGTQKTLAVIHAHRLMLFVAAMTLIAAAVLAIVFLHMLAN